MTRTEAKPRAAARRDGARPSSVLFVCMGNICRSPAAAGVMRSLVARRGLGDEIRVDSAGTIGYHAGEPPDRRMRAAAARRGYEIDGAARQIRRGDAGRFDLIVAMDRSNLRGVAEICGDDAGARLLSDFLPAGAPVDVPDPYYGGGRGFETVLDLLEAACPRILDELAAEEA